MKEFTVGKNDAGQRLDRFVTKTVPLLPASLLQTHSNVLFCAPESVGAGL